jgi:hypothetical protein
VGGVHFVDRTLLRLTDAEERAEALTPAVGDRILAAAFLFHTIEVGPVTGLSVRDVELLPTAPRLQRLEGVFQHPVTGERWEATGTLVDAAAGASAHARLELRLTTETRLADTTVERLETESLSDLADIGAVDARIVADDGALPADPEQLDARRFTALKTLLHERFTQPDDVNVDLLVAQRGIDDFAGLLESFASPRHPSRVELELVVDGTLPSRIETYRVIAAALIDEDPVARLRDLVGEIQLGRAALERGTELASPPRGMSPRTDLPYVVLFPESTLDDADLPVPLGAAPTTPAEERAARLTELQTRLTPFGIALAPVPS